jgi:two-component system, chemotaxis family, sensor kinase CheA
MDDFEIELKLDFLTESEDLLESAESAFMRLEKERESPDLLNEIFRLAHNLKGTSKAVGFDQLAELTHTAENLILKLKDGTLLISDSVVSTLLEFKDKVTEMVNGLKLDLDASFDILEVQKRIESEINSEGMAKIKEESIIEEVETSQTASPTIENQDVEINEAALDSLRESGFSEEQISELTNRPIESTPVGEVKLEVLPLKDEQKSPSKPVSQNENEESIRVKLSRIDMINNIIGELVILQTIISQRRYEFIQDDLSNKSIGVMGKLFKEVQELAMSLRMLPLKPTFQKMTRIVRDTSKLLGKEVNLILVGENTEVDKTVLEKLSDPLVHIVRNAVDHGLELPHEREEKGKAPIGNVELFAYHEGSNLVIQVTDDGKGISPTVIREKLMVLNWDTLTMTFIFYLIS